MKIRKKPVVVDGIQFRKDNLDEVRKFCPKIKIRTYLNGDPEAMISTLEGEMHAAVSDWIIKGVNGEFYSCKESIFKKTYDIIGEKDTGVINW